MKIKLGLKHWDENVCHSVADFVWNKETYFCFASSCDCCYSVAVVSDSL